MVCQLGGLPSFQGCAFPTQMSQLMSPPSLPQASHSDSSPDLLFVLGLKHQQGAPPLWSCPLSFVPWAVASSFNPILACHLGFEDLT